MIRERVVTHLVNGHISGRYHRAMRSRLPSALVLLLLIGSSPTRAWQVHFPLGGPGTTVVAIAGAPDGDVVAVVHGYGALSPYPEIYEVVRLAANDGAERWRYQVPGSVNALAVDSAGGAIVAAGSTPPTAPADFLVVTPPLPGGFLVVKLDGASGAPMWTHAETDDSHADAVAVDSDGNVVAAGTVQENLTRVVKLAGDTGTPFWTVNDSTTVSGRAVGILPGRDPLVVLGSAFGCCKTRALVRLDGGTGLEKWRAPLGPDAAGPAGPTGWSPKLAIAPDGSAYVASETCLEYPSCKLEIAHLAGDTGTSLWSQVVPAAAPRGIATTAASDLVVLRTSYENCPVGGPHPGYGDFFTRAEVLRGADGGVLMERPFPNLQRFPCSGVGQGYGMVGLASGDVVTIGATVPRGRGLGTFVSARLAAGDLHMIWRRPYATLASTTLHGAATRGSDSVVLSVTGVTAIGAAMAVAGDLTVNFPQGPAHSGTIFTVDSASGALHRRHRRPYAFP
jgi:outer membrane protein assembly factor BamB